MGFFHGICKVFCNFWKFDGFSALLVFAGGAGRARKFNFEKLTLVMRALPLTVLFFLDMRDKFLGMNALLITPCRFIDHQKICEVHLRKDLDVIPFLLRYFELFIVFFVFFLFVFAYFCLFCL